MDCMIWYTSKILSMPSSSFLPLHKRVLTFHHIVRFGLRRLIVELQKSFRKAPELDEEQVNEHRCMAKPGGVAPHGMWGNA